MPFFSSNPQSEIRSPQFDGTTTNASMSPRQVRKFCKLDAAGETILILSDDGYSSPKLDEDSYENPLNPVGETGDTTGVFTQTWDVDDVNPIEKAKLITSRVSWIDAKGEEKAVTLVGVCIDQSN
jgi:hypothetical protein